MITTLESMIQDEVRDGGDDPNIPDAVRGQLTTLDGLGVNPILTMIGVEDLNIEDLLKSHVAEDSPAFQEMQTLIRDTIESFRSE